tara:strand:+ start:192 stop:1223 length:1032 start_codon:yes stop_codon:yes gene_type:complete
MNKTIIFALVVIISCGGSDVPIEESAINTETTTTTTIQSTTTTISKNKDEFYTTGGVVTFTNEEIKDTFSEFFELKIKDASVVSNEIFHETAGFDLEDCIEVFKDDFANKDWSEEYGVNSIDEWCKRTVTLETEKIFEYPVVKENISISCKSEFNLYMETFIETYIKEDTFERTWNNDSWFNGSTKLFGIGVVNNDVTYLSFVFDVFPAGQGAYIFNDWFEINYDFTTCSPIFFEDIIEIPENYIHIFPQLENYSFEVTEATLIAHIFDLNICGEDNLFCKPFLYLDEFEYYPYPLDFLINERGLIVNLGNYFVHRGPNYRFLKWEEVESISSEYVLSTVYYP